MSDLPAGSVPNTLAKSYSITAEVEINFGADGLYLVKYNRRRFLVRLPAALDCRGRAPHLGLL